MYNDDPNITAAQMKKVLNNLPTLFPILMSFPGATGRKWGVWQCDQNAGTGILGNSIQTSFAGTGFAIRATSTDDGSSGFIFKCVTDATSGNYSMVLTNFNFASKFSPRIKVRIRNNSGRTTNVRMFTGFGDSTTSLVSADALGTTTSGIAVGFDETDTNYVVCTNDGAGGAQQRIDTGIAKDDGVFHDIEILTNDGGLNWWWRIDTNDYVIVSTQLPAPTVFLRFWILSVATETTSTAEADIVYAEAEVSM